jgi:hypothetical protein
VQCDSLSTDHHVKIATSFACEATIPQKVVRAFRARKEGCAINAFVMNMNVGILLLNPILVAPSVYMMLACWNAHRTAQRNRKSIKWSS